LRFWLLERLVLRFGVWLQRLLMWTWRTEPPSPAFFTEVAALPRVIFLIFHGTFFEALAFGRVWEGYGRRWMILTTPSLDGRLAVSMLNRLRFAHTALTFGARGTREYIARVGAGDVGLMLVDGSRGPRGVVKPGIARTIAAAQARVVAVGFAASRAGHTRSWDRTVIPAPFARVHAHCRLLEAPPSGSDYAVAELQAALDAAQAEAARAIASR
jgi:lysophospholipid acyltransferase (LPLAT)-like uncharacterized protein